MATANQRDAGGTTAITSVAPVVLTYRRPRLAGDVVRSLLDEEGFEPGRVIVVDNGTSGLDDPGLERSVRMVRLPTNIGPAGGFRAGLVAAFEDPATRWAYLCEDDVGLFGLPAPRVPRLLQRVDERDRDQRPVGAVVAYGRRFVGRGHSLNVVPGPGEPPLVEVDVAAWGASLVHRRVVDRGVLPSTEWYFGYEDFDFFCRVRAAGLQVLLDAEAARVAAAVQTSAGRDGAIAHARPTDQEEPWRAYYVARNFVHLARAHGSATWMAWHLAYSARRLQLASSGAERRATLHGLVDGFRGRLGAHPDYRRAAGEREAG